MANTIFAQSTVKNVDKQQTRPVQSTESASPDEQASKVQSVQQNALSGQDAVTSLEKRTEAQAEALREKVAELNSHMQNLNRKLQFSVDDVSGDTIVKVIDSETDELIRQVPSEELLDVKHAISEYRGLLLETKA